MRRSPLTVLLWFLIAALPSVEAMPRDSDRAPRADRPSPRADPNSKRAHEDLVRKAKSGGIDVYFLGDSITRRWGTSDDRYRPLLENWNRNFFGWNAGNFGWGADRTENILWRVKNGELKGVHPKVIVLMAGTNNVGSQSPGGESDVEARAADAARGVAAIIAACRKKAPAAVVILMAVTPREDNPLVMPVIDRLNERLAGLADGRRVRFLDLKPQLTDEAGRLLPGMTDPDSLHLSIAAYQVWADALRPILRELLGPPAKTDHAPPPTGDPSARPARDEPRPGRMPH